jgi:hypothetical protein
MTDMDLGQSLRRRVNTDPEHVEKGLAALVLTLIDVVRELMERQAVRRIEHGSLTPDEIERLGQTFMKLNARLEELRDDFGLTESDLDPSLGPLGIGPLERR